MTIAYVITTREVEDAQYFINRFLKSHCAETEKEPLYVASLEPSANHLAKTLGVPVKEILESAEHRPALLQDMYKSLRRAVRANRPVASLRSNLSLKSRASVLQALPVSYHRVSIVIGDLGDRSVPTLQEGFDELWELSTGKTEDGFYNFKFIRGGFDEVKVEED